MPTILVLDDDEIILDLLKTVLGDAGYETILAPEVSRIPPKASADLVITDLVLSRAYRREEALAWVTTLRKRFGGSPLLIVTAHAPAMDEPDGVLEQLREASAAGGVQQFELAEHQPELIGPLGGADEFRDE